MPTSGCQLADRQARAVELGWVTEKEACGIEKTLRELGPEPDIALPEGRLGLLIEGTAYEKWVAQCRTGSFPIGEGYKAADLYCNAILKVAAGELEPTKICGPPRCAEPRTPIWAYNEAELRDLAEDNR